MSELSKEDALFLQRVEDLWDVIASMRKSREKERFNSLCSAYKDFADTLPEELREHIFLSKPMLQNVVSCYFDSIYRYKIFAKTALADSHKQAAYQFKWISKIKPIQIRHDIEDLAVGLNLVNAYFAVHVAITFLQASESVDILSGCEQAVYDNLVYQAQFRHVSGRALAAELCTIVKSCKPI